ncbi:hypothetical protein ABMA27_005913 [Loxostege sticticalis]|uniref:Uncharacterized protein n=1 Tax=Loxostege sticticalis TaxID=481309 RepID=A0ABR3HHC5_LOXSC
MKFFIVFALIAAVASAVPLHMAEVDQILQAIQSPSTNPATAAALEQMLADALGPSPGGIIAGPILVPAKPEHQPIHVGPAIIPEYHPIHVGPALLPEPEYHPIHVGPALLPEQPTVNPAPIVKPEPVEIPTNTPLVQIILNINKADAIPPVSVVTPENIVAPELPGSPINIVEEAENHIVPDPIQIVEVAPIVPEPIQIAEPAPVKPEPIQIAEPAPIAPESIQIAEPAPIAPESIQIAEPAPIAPESIQIAEPAPIAPESIQIAEPAPIDVAPIVMPDALN